MPAPHLSSSEQFACSAVYVLSPAHLLSWKTRHRAALLLPLTRVSSLTQCIVLCCICTAGALHRSFYAAHPQALHSRASLHQPGCRRSCLVPLVPELPSLSQLGSTAADPSQCHQLADQAGAAQLPIEARDACCSRCRARRAVLAQLSAGCCCQLLLLMRRPCGRLQAL